MVLLLALASSALAGDDADLRAAVRGAMERGDRAAALALLDAAAVEGAHDRHRLLDAARVAAEAVGGREGDVRAARDLVAALRLDRSDRDGAYTQAMQLRSRAVRRETDAASAQTLCRGLVELYPESVEFAYDLALACRDAGLPDEARRVYERIVETAPSETRARFELAALDEDRGELGSAVALYDGLIGSHAPGESAALRACLQKAFLLLWRARDVGGARRALEAGVAATNASAPGPERDDFASRFESLRADLELEERHRARLREVGGRIDGVLLAAAAAWCAVLGGGVVWLRRAKCL
jgi:tetratricopeptide (TPR) repeat protein